MPKLDPTTAVPDDARGAAIALGNFDGVHRGHQAVIAAAGKAADALAAPLGVAVFEPHPRRYFQPESAPFRLQSPAQRARALAEHGVKEVFEIGFDAGIAQSTDREFAERVLKECLGVRHIAVGADFRFGRGRMGDVESLTRLGAEFGFDVTAVAPVGGAEKVSSSGVRGAIVAGDMEAAEQLLGRPWAIEGQVQRGFARGAGFGFPTANLDLGEYVRPKLGVYAVRVDLGDGVFLPGVASIGINPTVGALPAPLLEVHLMDFSGDLYGQRIEVELIHFLREEAAFASIETLKAQMTQDVIDARRALIGR